MEDFCNNPYPHPKPDTLQKINSLKSKPSKKKILKIVIKDVEV